MPWARVVLCFWHLSPRCRTAIHKAGWASWTLDTVHRLSRDQGQSLEKSATLTLYHVGSIPTGNTHNTIHTVYISTQCIVTSFGWKVTPKWQTRKHAFSGPETKLARTYQASSCPPSRLSLLLGIPNKPEVHSQLRIHIDTAGLLFKQNYW